LWKSSAFPGLNFLGRGAVNILGGEKDAGSKSEKSEMGWLDESQVDKVMGLVLVGDGVGWRRGGMV
jgi:hypothetical protein